MTKQVRLSPRATFVKGAIYTYLRPRMAEDSAMIPLDPIVRDITAKAFDRPRLVTAIRAAAAGNLAADADLEDLPEMLQNIESLAGEASEAITEGGEMDNGEREKEETHDDDLSELVERIKALSPEDRERLDAMVVHKVEPEGDEETEEERAERMRLRAEDRAAGRRAARDEEPETEEEKRRRMEARDKKAKDEEAPEKKPITKEAMDAAIAAAQRGAIDNQRAIREAERVIRPWVGDLMLACDSAADVYKNALKMLGVKVDGIHPDAYRSILESKPKPGSQSDGRVAQDSATAAGFAERYPDAMRIGQM